MPYFKERTGKWAERATGWNQTWAAVARTQQLYIGGTFNQLSYWGALND